MSDTIIHPSALVERGAKLGTGVHISAFCIVKGGAELHDGVILHEHAHIASSVSLGKGCEVFPQAVLGMPPQDVKYKGEATRLVIGARNIIREHVTMHPGTAVGNGVTTIGDDGYFMIGSHVGHDCVVGNHVTFSNSAAIGGYVQVGDYVNLGGLVGVHQFVRIGHHAFVGAQAYLANDVIPYGMVAGNPARLNGLNVVGMQRTAMSRSAIGQARAAYKAIFCHTDGLFDDRLKRAQKLYKGDTPAMDIIDFINERSLRSLCMPDER
ncbi:MAG: acyl-[acyl-carrier-protein]--UDP-N-acetylglucosamine O-acyltransferase [Robiginitomaculum sp.]|nr:MAG: acyl-[acyl-carrier-protein]--UDP-N-acetylglucosamine O-acyltransferase [Robiginitomaculum sp.]